MRKMLAKKKIDGQKRMSNLDSLNLLSLNPFVEVHFPKL